VTRPLRGASARVLLSCLGPLLLTGLARGDEAAAPAADSASALPEGEGRALVARVCSQCHSLEVVVGVRLTRRQWEAKIDQMLAKGAKLSDEEIDLAADYLARNFGPRTE